MIQNKEDVLTERLNNDKTPVHTRAQILMRYIENEYECGELLEKIKFNVITILKKVNCSELAIHCSNFKTWGEYDRSFQE